MGTCLTCANHPDNAKSIDDAPAACWSCGPRGIHWKPKEDTNVTTIAPPPAPPKAPAPLDVQVAGNHYKEFKIQPIEFAMVNRLNSCQTIALRYLVRRKGDKAKRLEDLDKCIHTIQIYKQMIEEGTIDV